MIKIVHIFFLFLTFTIGVSAMERIIIREPRQVESEKDNRFEDILKQSIIKSLSSRYKVEFTDRDVSSFSKETDLHLYINLLYVREKNFPPNIYAQVYNPQTGEIIDAISVSTKYELLNEIEAELDKNEFNIPDSERAQEFSRKLDITLKLNPARKTQGENIIEHLTKERVGKSPEFQKQKTLSGDASKNVFLLLEEQIVVTATRTKSKIKDAPAAVYVITRKQMEERGYRTLIDALKDVPGFDFQHTYGVYPELVHQRGLIGENTRSLVYVDGVSDNNISGVGPLAGTLHFPLSNVDRIEIVSGPASSLYGANAFNGIINIITRDGANSGGSHVEAIYGGYDSNFRSPGAGLNFSTRGKSQTMDMSYSLGGYYFQTEGPNFSGIQRIERQTVNPTAANYANPNNVNNYVENKACGGVCNSTRGVGYTWSPGFNSANVDTYNLTAKFTIGNFRFQTVNWQYLNGFGTFTNGTNRYDVNERGLETNVFDDRNNARRAGVLLGNAGTRGRRGGQYNFRNNSIVVGHTKQISETLTLDSELVVRNTEIMSSSFQDNTRTKSTNSYYNFKDSNITSNNYTTSFTTRPDHSYQLEEKLQYNPSQKHSSVAGIIARHSDVPEFTSVNTSSQATLSQDISNLSNRVSINNFGAFYQHTFRPSDYWIFSAGYRQDYSSIFGRSQTPRVSAIYKPTQNLTFKLLLGTGFREPSTFEFLNRTATRKENRGLRPEYLRSVEIGIAYRWNKLYLSAQSYYYKVTNLISTAQTLELIPSSSNTWQQNQNVGKAEIFGTEIEANINLTEKLLLNANYTYSEGRYFDLLRSVTSSPSAYGRPGDDLTSDLLSLAGIKNIPSSGPIPHIAPNKFFLGGTYTIWKKMSLYVGVNYVDIRRTVVSNPVKTVSGYTMGKLNFRWDDFIKDGMYINLLVVNLANNLYFDPGVLGGSGSLGGPPTMHPLEKRNIWISVGYNF